MPWSKHDYPASMKNLTSEVRNKAIDIANALVGEEKYEEGRAIAIATAQAEKWAKHRDKPIRKKKAEGSTGQAVASGPETDEFPIHVIPDPKGEGWLAKQHQKRVAQGQSKQDVLRKAREKAQAQKVPLFVHDEEGEVMDEEENWSAKTIFLKPLILRVQSDRKIKGFRKMVIMLLSKFQWNINFCRGLPEKINNPKAFSSHLKDLATLIGIITRSYRVTICPHCFANVIDRKEVTDII